MAAQMLHSTAIASLAEPGSEGQVVAYGALAIALMALAHVGVPAMAAAAVVRVSGKARQGPRLTPPARLPHKCVCMREPPVAAISRATLKG